MRVLIVEDEPRMTELLRQGLYERGFTVMSATDGVTGLEIATAFQFDAIVLDIGLPLMDGYEMMTALRKRAHGTPVLMLTARDTEDDIIVGLDLGADDYMTKPFSFLELAARLQAICRPGKKESMDTLAEGDVMVDLTRRAARRGQHNVDLTRLEMLLLVSLMRDAGRCVSRQKLMDSIWGVNHAVSSSALDVLVNSLRTKIDNPFEQKLIGTARGLGYYFRHTTTDAERLTS
jgi:DNA-binding response OmpR family regulator